MTRRQAISSGYYLDEFSEALSLEHKIKIFYSRILEWQLIPAKQVLEKIENPEIATLHIVMSFFEMIAKYKAGYVGEGDAARYFKIGVESVIPKIKERIPDDEYRKEFIKAVYKEVRCGLYHVGLIGKLIVIDSSMEGLIARVTFKKGPPPDTIYVLTINPKELVQAMENYLDNYVSVLQNPGPRSDELRQNFEKRFDFDSGISQDPKGS